MTPDGPENRAPQDEQGYLASVSDVMSGLLFIFIITLVVFAIALLKQKDTYGEELQRLTGVRDEQRELLMELERLLRERGVVVTVNPEQGVLRLGERLLFASGSARLDEQGHRTVAELIDVLELVLPCYTALLDEAAREEGCGKRGSRGRVDALFIEGHTDNQPLRTPVNGLRDNLDLSAARAKAIFELAAGRFDGFRNGSHEPILGVSGYAEHRSIASNDHEDGRAQNRRIDLRFIMTQPPGVLPPPVRETAEGLGLGNP